MEEQLKRFRAYIDPTIDSKLKIGGEEGLTNQVHSLRYFPFKDNLWHPVSDS
jgi:hypothetical protein